MGVLVSMRVGFCVFAFCRPVGYLVSVSGFVHMKRTLWFIHVLAFIHPHCNLPVFSVKSNIMMWSKSRPGSAVEVQNERPTDLNQPFPVCDRDRWIYCNA